MPKADSTIGTIIREEVQCWLKRNIHWLKSGLSVLFQLSIFFQLSISNKGDPEVVGIAIVNTILGGSAGGIAALILSFFENGKWSYLITLNGALTGTYLLYYYFYFKTF